MMNPAPSDASEQPAQYRLFLAALIGILAVLAASWYAYDSHVTTRKAYLIERNFRFLSEQGRALGAAIANYENIFQSILEGRPDPLGETPCAQGREVPQEARKLCIAPHVKRVMVSESDKRQGELSVQFAMNELRLEYATDLVRCRKTNQRSLCSIHAEIDIAKIMDALPMEELFSDLLLADTQGHVVYQRRSRRDASDLQFADLGVLLKKQSKEYDAALPFMNVVSIGGTNFRVFAQAGLVSVRHQSADVRYVDFILSGIVPDERFDAEATVIPSHLLLIAVGMILAAFLTLPYLKLKALPPNESLSLPDALTLMFSSLMWVGFLTFGLLLVVAHQHTRSLFDQMLQKSATAISGNFAEDLEEARRQLSTFDALCESNRPCRRAVEGGDTTSRFVRFTIALENGNRAFELEENAGEPRKAPLLAYDINKMFWVGRDGTKLADWWRRRAWQKVSLGERNYVKRIFDGSGLPSPRSHANEDPYWIEPTYSWISGKNTVVVSGPSHVHGGPIPSAVAALELTLPSVMDPVVQPGFGFAVVNELGKVIFHSDSKRNLREDFFAETDQNLEFRTYLLARTPHFSSGQYWGKDRRFFTAPLKDTDGWSLVVYRDTALLDDAELRALFGGAVLFIVYSALVLGIGFFGCVVYPELKRGHGGWFQPRQHYATTYRRIAFLNVALLILFGLVQSHPYLERHYPDWQQLGLLSPFVLPLVMAVTAYGLAVFRSARPPDEDQPRYRRDYAMMAVSCLLLFAMAPAYGFFKFAWNGEMTLHALFTQYDFAKDMEHREQALRKFYQGVTFRPETAGEQFIRARLDRYRRDVYTEFLLHPQLDARPGLSERILALLRRALSGHLASEASGLLDREGYNRAWLVVNQGSGGAQPEAVKPQPGIPSWLYWALSIGSLFVFQARHAVTHGMGQMDRVAPMAVSIVLLIMVSIAVVWPNPSVLLGAAAIGLFMLVLYALPRITNEGLSAFHRQSQPAQQESHSEPHQRGASSTLSHILWPVKVGLAILVGFIILTQEEYRPIALAALAAILPELSKIVPELSKILSGFKLDRARTVAG